MKHFFKSFIIIVIGSVAALGSLHFFWPKWSPVDSYLASRFSAPTVVAERGPLTESLKVTNAKLVARESFELSFPFGGRLTDIFVVEDQLVYDPIPLAKLDTTILESEKKKAVAVMHQNQANVAKLRLGARTEDLAISNNEVKAAKTTLTNSKRKLVNAIRAAYSDTDDAIRTKTDPMFVDPRGDSPETDFTASDSDLENDIEAERHSLEGRLDDWENEVRGLDIGDNLTKAQSNAENALKKSQEFLDDLSVAVSALSAGGGLSQETLDTWKADLSTARSTVSTTRAALSAAFTTYQGAGRDLTTTESQYSFKEAGSMSQDIDIAKFQLEEAETVVTMAEKQLSEATLETPHSHLLVKKIYPKIGEHVDASEPVIVLDTPELKIQLDIPEEDMGKVTIGNPITVSLDAFPDMPATGEIETIEPQEIVKNESVYYRVSARLLSDQKKEWRSGMGGTANVIVGQSATTLQVPKSTVYSKNNKRFVQILDWNETPEEQEVIVGIQDDKMIEIKSGLEENQEIVLYPSPLK